MEKLLRCFREYGCYEHRQHLAVIIAALHQDTSISDWSKELRGVPNLLREMLTEPPGTVAGSRASAAGASGVTASSSAIASLNLAIFGITMLVCVHLMLYYFCVECGLP
jgi:hypothetical protein